MVQKAVEMGVSRLCPVRTDHTQISRVNIERLVANIREACEQCGVLRVPTVAPLVTLSQLVIGATPDAGTIIFCDERAPVADPATALSAIPRDRSVSVLIGPEGGFSDAERQTLLALPNALAIAIGPRILRADTAAVAALAAVQMVWGDWRG